MSELSRHLTGLTRSVVGFQILILLITGCTSRGTSPGTDQATLEYGARVGALARTIRMQVVSIQLELSNSSPNIEALQTAHADIKAAYVELNNLGPAPDGMGAVHDSSIGAAFDCEYMTQQAIAGVEGDLTQCLSEVEKAVELTQAYVSSTPGNP